MSAVLTMTALISVYLVAEQIIRRRRLVFMWAMFGAAPLALTAYWIKTNDLDLFLWIKIYSVMFCICWGTWLRFTCRNTNPWLMKTVALLLAGNILEATIVDMMSDEIAHRLNALSGGFLILTLLYGNKRTWIDTASKHLDLRFDISLTWIVGYTIWNLTFVYLNYPSYTGHHVAILGAALIVAIGNPQRWVQARAATLGLSLLPTATSYSGMLKVIDTTSWYNEQIAVAMAALVLSWIVIVFTSEQVLRLSQRRSWTCVGRQDLGVGGRNPIRVRLVCDGRA